VSFAANGSGHVMGGRGDSSLSEDGALQGGHFRSEQVSIGINQMS